MVMGIRIVMGVVMIMGMRRVVVIEQKMGMGMRMDSIVTLS